MKGLLMKEWCVLRGQNVVFPLVLVVLMLFAIVSNSTVMLCYIPMIVGMLPMTMMSYDEVSNWDKYSLTLPFSRRMIVSAKYLTCVLAAFAAVALISVPMWFGFRNEMPGVTGSMYAIVLVLLVCLALVLPSLMLPLNFAVGAAKSRVISMFEIMIICAGLPFLTGALEMSENGPMLFGKNIAQLLTANPALVMIAVAAVTAVIVFISWMIAVVLYRRREL